MTIFLYNIIRIRTKYGISSPFGFNSNTISCQKGVCELLGLNEMDLQRNSASRFLKLLHSEERNIIPHIILGGFRFAAKFGMDFSDQLHIAFRIKSGDVYIPIEFTAGIYELDVSKSIKSCFVIIRKNPFPRNLGCIEFDWKSQFSKGKKFKDFMQLQPCNELSMRELEILELVAKGLKNDYISNTLFIAIETVRTHKKNIMRKLGFSDSNKMILHYHENLKGRFKV